LWSETTNWINSRTTHKTEEYTTHDWRLTDKDKVADIYQLEIESRFRKLSITQN